MPVRQNQIKSVILVVWMVLLSAFTVVLGSVPMRALLKVNGKNAFVMFQSLLVLVLWMAGWHSVSLTLLALSLMTLVYSEMEAKNIGYFLSGLAAVGSSAGMLAILFAVWTQQAGEEWLTVLQAKMGDLLAQLEKSGVVLSESLTVNELLIQIPSVAIIALAMALFFALAMEERSMRWLGVYRKPERSLLQFKAPDYFIWIFVSSMAGSFIQLDMEVLRAISVNFFNASLVVFFFQGIAVIYYFFDRFKVGFWGRLLSILLIFGQPLGMMGVSFVGVMDFWAEFRNRPKKGHIPANKEFR